MDELMAATSPNDLMTPSDAARVLGLSPDSVRVLSDSGRLPAMRTVSGRRLFKRGDVDRLAAERALHSASAASAKAHGAADTAKKT
jgi:excisionase family DNA binding protein